MKRNTILIFLGLLLFSSLTVSAMAYSVEGGLATRGFSLIDTVLVNKIPGCGNCLELKQINVPSTKDLIARAAGCASCEDEGDDES